MKVLPLSEVKAKLSQLVDVVERRDESITITRNGIPAAILVSKDEYDSWHETISIMQDAEFLEEIGSGIRALARTRKRYTLNSLFDE